MTARGCDRLFSDEIVGTTEQLANRLTPSYFAKNKSEEHFIENLSMLSAALSMAQLLSHPNGALEESGGSMGRAMVNSMRYSQLIVHASTVSYVWLA